MNSRLRNFCVTVSLFLVTAFASFAQTGKTYVVPTVITNHYDKSEPESHGVVTVAPDEKLKVEVRDLAKNTAYNVSLLEESSGKRNSLGTFTTDRRGYALKEFAAKGLLKTFNALLILHDEDVIQSRSFVKSRTAVSANTAAAPSLRQRWTKTAMNVPAASSTRSVVE